MIDSGILKKLGWSKSLIDEVTRVSEQIDQSAVSTPKIENSNCTIAKSGDAMYFEVPPVNSSAFIEIGQNDNEHQ